MPIQPYSVANCLTARMHKGINSTLDERQTPVVTHSLRGEGFDASEDGTGRGTPLVPVGVTIHGTDPTVQKVASYDEVAQCLRARTPGNIDNSSTTVVQQPVAFHPTQDPIVSTDGTTHAMGCGSSGGTATVAVATLFIQDDTTPKVNEERAGCLRRDAGGEGACVMTPAMQVRRLTPTECERLQGFPDDYTAIPWRGKPADQCPDGPRYKALGNSWAVPVVRWIGERIARAA